MTTVDAGDEFLPWGLLEEQYRDYGAESVIRCEAFRRLKLPEIPPLASLRLPKAFWTKEDVVPPQRKVVAEAARGKQRVGRGRGRLRDSRVPLPGASRSDSNSSRGTGGNDGSGSTFKVPLVPSLPAGGRDQSPMERRGLSRSREPTPALSINVSSASSTSDFQDASGGADLGLNVHEQELGDSNLMSSSPFKCESTQNLAQMAKYRSGADLMNFSSASASGSSVDLDLYGGPDGDHVNIEPADVQEMQRQLDNCQNSELKSDRRFTETKSKTVIEPTSSWPPVRATESDVKASSGSGVFPMQSYEDERSLAQDQRRSSEPAASGLPWPANVIRISGNSSLETKPLFPTQDFSTEAGLVKPGFLESDYIAKPGAGFQRNAVDLADLITGPVKKQNKKKRNGKSSSPVTTEEVYQPPSVQQERVQRRSSPAPSGFQGLVNEVNAAANPNSETTRLPTTTTPPSMAKSKGFDLMVDGLNANEASPSKVREVFGEYGKVHHLHFQHGARDAETKSARITFADENERDHAVACTDKQDLGELGTVSVYPVP